MNDKLKLKDFGFHSERTTLYFRYGSAAYTMRHSPMDGVICLKFHHEETLFLHHGDVCVRIRPISNVRGARSIPRERKQARHGLRAALGLVGFR
jgi:hypothetical protein